MESVNVIVIGAGVIGAAIASGLARRGALVTVIDMRGPGRGASQASAGLLAPYTEARSETPLLKMAVRSLALFDDFVAAACAGSGRSVEYTRTGTLEVALTDDDVGRLRASKAWLDTTGVESEWMDASSAREFERAITPDVRGALFVRTHGFVGVPGLVAALAQSARFAGAVFEAPVEAVDIVSDGRSVQVRAGDRGYRAEHAVIAAGSWSQRIRVAGAADLPVKPIRGQLLHLRWAAPPRPAHVVWSHACYAVPWSDGRLLVGATVEDVGFDESTTVSGMQSLTNAVTDLLPGAGRAVVLEARAGLRPATPDGLPFIGPSGASPNVTYATGHYRNGILLAPLTAAMVEAHILDGRSDDMMAFTSPSRPMLQKT